MSDDKPRRKMAVILASDMVGFSKAMGEDEAGTLKKLKESRAHIDKAIAAHYGRIFNTAGDSVIAEFSSPVDAVTAAIEFQKLLKQRNALDWNPSVYLAVFASPTVCTQKFAKDSIA